MATKPTIADAAWATDTNFASGDASGTPTKVNPTGIKAQGWRPGDALGYVGAWFNYMMNQAYLWFTYLGDLHNSADFLNKSYTWLTGMHRFTGGMRSAGIGLESGDVLYTDTAGVAAPRVTAKQLDLRSATGSANNAIQWSSDTTGIYAVNNTAPGIVNIDLPTGAVLTNVRAWVQDPGGADTITMTVYAVSRNPATGAVALGSALGGAQTSSGTGVLEDIETTAFTTTIDNTAFTYEVHFTTTTTGGLVRVCYVTFSDAGFKGNG